MLRRDSVSEAMDGGAPRIRAWMRVFAVGILGGALLTLRAFKLNLPVDCTPYSVPPVTLFIAQSVYRV